ARRCKAPHYLSRPMNSTGHSLPGVALNYPLTKSNLLYWTLKRQDSALALIASLKLLVFACAAVKSLTHFKASLTPIVACHRSSSNSQASRKKCLQVHPAQSKSSLTFSNSSTERSS